MYRAILTWNGEDAQGMDAYTEATSYRDHLDLDDGGTSPDAHVVRVCEELERQGWKCTSLRYGRGLRYVCPADTDRHAGIWISLTLVTQEFIDATARRTCLEPFTITD
jgi:hypothetical protein